MDKPNPVVPDQSDPTRRGFLKLASGILAFVGGVVLGIPFLGSLGGPAFRTKKRHFAKVTLVDGLPSGEPEDMQYLDLTKDAYIHEMTTRNVWVIKHSQGDVTVFSPICPHLGCRYNWHPESRRFVCPCHGSVFALDGKVLAGPSPRPLDTLPKRITNGELFVEWERFEVGIPQKKVV